MSQTEKTTKGVRVFSNIISILLIASFIYLSVQKGYDCGSRFSNSFVDSVIVQNKFLQSKVDSIQKDSLYRDYLVPENRAYFKFWTEHCLNQIDTL